MDSKFQIKSEKDIPYLEANYPGFNSDKHQLDLFYPEDISQLKPVMIFIHGGSWSSGNKSIYSKLGENFARKGIVTALINYRLAPSLINEMPFDCASAVKWLIENGNRYGGDKSKITLAGHSAGGHLSALLCLNDDFFNYIGIKPEIKACVLIDAFGLNIYKFLKEHESPYLEQLYEVFTTEEANWKKGSPSENIRKSSSCFLVLTGSASFPFLIYDNKLFVEKLKSAGIAVDHKMIKGKSHIQMISQFENKDNSLYTMIIEFIK